MIFFDRQSRSAGFRSALSVSFVFTLLGLLLHMSPACADPPAVTLTPGGGVMFLPRILHVDETQPAGGAIIGFPMSPILALELRGNGTSATGKNGFPDRDLVHVEGNLTWFMNEDQSVTPLLTAG